MENQIKQNNRLLKSRQNNSNIPAENIIINNDYNTFYNKSTNINNNQDKNSPNFNKLKVVKIEKLNNRNNYYDNHEMKIESFDISKGIINNFGNEKYSFNDITENSTKISYKDKNSLLLKEKLSLLIDESLNNNNKFISLNSNSNRNNILKDENNTNSLINNFGKIQHRIKNTSFFNNYRNLNNNKNNYFSTMLDADNKENANHIPHYVSNKNKIYIH